VNDNLYLLENVGRQIRDERISNAAHARQARLVQVRRRVRRAGKVIAGTHQPA